jgi:type III secretory pathway component EscR
MRTIDDCKMDDGFINYLIFLFCDIGDKLLGLGLTLLVNIKNSFFFKIIIFCIIQGGLAIHSIHWSWCNS